MQTHNRNGTQYGSRKDRSCTTQLAATVHNIWSIVNESCDAQAVALDFSKALDNVPHGRLLFKLAETGLDHCSISWIKTFLTKRTQQVLLHGSKSKRVAVTFGVLQ